MLGANELGIRVRWKFRFPGHGKVVQPALGTVYVDLGGQLRPGVIDHHFADSGYESTTSALANNPEYVLEHLLGHANATYYQGLDFQRKEMIFEFATHRYPDWDGMSCFYLTRHLIQSGCLPNPAITEALSEAANEIDQGRVRIGKQVVRPFLVYLMMMNNGTSQEDCLLRGASLLDEIVRKHGSGMTKESLLSPFTPSSEFAVEVRQLQEDYDLFQDDLVNAKIFEMIVPTQNSIGVSTKAFAFGGQPQCRLHKYWVREETEAGILFVPYERNGRIHRVVISVDPYSNFVLPCLGYGLEQAETETRRNLGKQRTGKPRFEPEYCDNDDPWYDGRGHGFTIVDSPRAGTVLEYQEILDQAAGLFRSLPEIDKNASYDAFISYRRSGGSDLAWALKTHLELKGKKVFLDVDSLQSGPFDRQLLKSIVAAHNFISLLTPGSLDQCRIQDDWMRKEISEALARGKKIIPVFKEGFVFPALEDVPDEIRGLLSCNGVTLNHEYFYACIEKLLRFMT